MTEFPLQKLLGRDEIEWDLEGIAAYLRDQVRPGDKLHEELLTHAEGVRSTRHRRIFIAERVRGSGLDREGPVRDLDAEIDELARLAAVPDRISIIRKMRELITDYEPSEMWKG